MKNWSLQFEKQILNFIGKVRRRKKWLSWNVHISAEIQQAYKRIHKLTSIWEDTNLQWKCEWKKNLRPTFFALKNNNTFDQNLF